MRFSRASDSLIFAANSCVFFNDNINKLPNPLKRFP
jgi:hypothetical protein